MSHGPSLKSRPLGADQVAHHLAIDLGDPAGFGFAAEIGVEPEVGKKLGVFKEGSQMSFEPGFDANPADRIPIFGAVTAHAHAGATAAS